MLTGTCESSEGIPRSYARTCSYQGQVDTSITRHQAGAECADLQRDDGVHLGQGALGPALAEPLQRLHHRDDARLLVYAELLLVVPSDDLVPAAGSVNIVSNIQASMYQCLLSR